VITAPGSPWQNAYAERLIGSIRRECLDHVIVVNEIGLSRILKEYLAYYHQSRTHLSLAKDSPHRRPSRHQPSARSQRFHKSAAYTIATTVGRRNHTPLSLPVSASGTVGVRLKLHDRANPVRICTRPTPTGDNYLLPLLNRPRRRATVDRSRFEAYGVFSRDNAITSSCRRFTHPARATSRIRHRMSSIRRVY
jgi:Integrase core domain